MWAQWRCVRPLDEIVALGGRRATLLHGQHRRRVPLSADEDADEADEGVQPLASSMPPAQSDGGVPAALPA